MICYKDKTFCNSDCANTECHRFFSDEDWADARSWWSHDPDNAPIAFADFHKTCDEYFSYDEDDEK